MFNKKDNLYHGYIYKVTNNINNKVYIGQTSTSIEKRWTQHKSAARTAKNNKIIFYNAINKYGEDNFTIDVIYEVSCITKDELIFHNLIYSKHQIYFALYVHDCHSKNMHQY